MSEQEQPMALYLKRVLALKDERREIPTEEELQEVAREIGITDDDLAEVARSAEAHYLRGQGFLEHQRYGDAIHELEESTTLAPGRVEWLHALARAHAGRWQEQRQAPDRERAELLARRCLELDPRHQASITVLDELDRALTASPAGRSTPKRSGIKPIVITMALGIVLVGINVFLRSGEETARETPRPSVQEPVSETEIAASTASEIDIPVSLDAGSTDVVLSLETRRARLQTYDNGSSFFTLHAVVSNLGPTEFDKLGARLELLDDGGTVVLSDTFEALGGASPVARPQDVFPLRLLKETRDTVREARLVIETVDQNPGAPSYPESPEIKIQWQAEAPAGLHISVRERGYRFSESSLAKDGSGYFDAVLEIENAGDRTIRALKLAAEISGPGGSWSVVDEKRVALTSGPSLRPGEVWVERFLQEVEGRPESYRVSVAEIQ